MEGGTDKNMIELSFLVEGTYGGMRDWARAERNNTENRLISNQRQDRMRNDLAEHGFKRSG